MRFVAAVENLTRIARHYGLTPGALLAVNGIEDSSLIPNERINVAPPGDERESQ